MTTSADWFARPVINVSNVEASIRFYVDKLGFQLDWHFGEPIEVCEVWRGKCQLILCQHFPEKVGKSLQFLAFDAGSRDAEIAAVDAYRAEIEGRGAAIREGIVYPILARMQEDGLITSEVRPSNSGPPRKYYRITTQGRHALREMNAYWDQMVAALQVAAKIKQENSDE